MDIVVKYVLLFQNATWDRDFLLQLRKETRSLWIVKLNVETMLDGKFEKWKKVKNDAIEWKQNLIRIMFVFKGN